MKKTRKMMTSQDKKDMFEMFEAGLPTKEIIELTGRCEGLIYNYKKKWKEQKALKAQPEEEQPEIKEEVPAGLDNSDYAKAYLAGDPAVIHSSFEIERTIKIRSKKTSILYEMDPSLDRKVMKITLADGQVIELELGLFEKFVDEGIDVYLEMRRTA